MLYNVNIKFVIIKFTLSEYRNLKTLGVRYIEIARDQLKFYIRFSFLERFLKNNLRSLNVMLNVRVCICFGPTDKLDKIYNAQRE